MWTITSKAQRQNNITSRGHSQVRQKRRNASAWRWRQGRRQGQPGGGGEDGGERQRHRLRKMKRMLHPKTEKCCLSFTSCLMRYLHLIDFWRQHRCILHCLWYPTILCVPFRDCWAKKIKMASESCVWWLVCV